MSDDLNHAIYRVVARIAEGQIETTIETPEMSTLAEANVAVSTLELVNGAGAIRVWDIRIERGVMKPCRVWEPTP